MMILNVHYTKQQVLDDLKAIEELREEDIKLPLAVIRREEPKAFRKVCYRARARTPERREYRRKYMESYCKKLKFKEYMKKRSKSLHILKTRHQEEFGQIFNELKTGNLVQSQIIC